MTDNGGAYANVVNIRQLTNDGFSVVHRMLSDVIRTSQDAFMCSQVIKLVKLVMVGLNRLFLQTLIV